MIVLGGESSVNVQRDQYNIQKQTWALGCAVRKSYTGIEMCADSTVCEYITCIHSGNQIVVAE